ncbi:universal stress protein [Streptomyces sp. GbtcB6]|uniref:universal stress protein n=1 Tax=Streptomyces sp. GbtcB6 TaxID=2824751 RepID=UPI001C2F7FD9|nr:universal stress protein [Streptomyces sp. GbtcB6]
MSGYDTCTSGRVVVGVSGSLGSVTALRRAVTEARRRQAELWPVLAWEPPGGELAARRSPVPPPLVEEWQRTARERLLGLLDEVFGDTGPGVALHGTVVRASPGLALVETADRDDDILVVGAGRRGWHRAFSGRVTRYCLAHAHCPVLAIPPSPLEGELASAHRRNAWHLPLDVRKLPC